MRLSWKDVATTLMAAAVAVIFVAHFQQWEWPLIGDVRLATLVVGAIGLGMCIVGGDPNAVTAKNAYTVFASSLGVGALALAALGAISDWPVVLAALVAVTLVLYVVTTVRHAVVEMPIARPV
jgi:uncharacterized membrane protein YccC